MNLVNINDDDTRDVAGADSALIHDSVMKVHFMLMVFECSVNDHANENFDDVGSVGEPVHCIYFTRDRIV